MHKCLYFKVYTRTEIESLWPNNVYKWQKIQLLLLKLSKTVEVNYSIKSGSVPRHHTIFNLNFLADWRMEQNIKQQMIEDNLLNIKSKDGRRVYNLI